MSNSPWGCCPTCGVLASCGCWGEALSAALAQRGEAERRAHHADEDAAATHTSLALALKQRAEAVAEAERLDAENARLRRMLPPAERCPTCQKLGRRCDDCVSEEPDYGF